MWREEAAGAYVSGEVRPVSSLAIQADPATFFGPRGDYVQGAQAVRRGHEAGAKMFAPGAENKFEILYLGSGESLAYWAGFQRATPQMQGNTVPFDLQVSEIFRREGGSRS